MEEPIDWAFPWTHLRSSERDEVKLKILDNGTTLIRTDDNGEDFMQFNFQCVFLNSKNKPNIVYTTSSKRLIEELKVFVPLKDKTVQITRTGTGFQTQYKVKEIK